MQAAVTFTDGRVTVAFALQRTTRQTLLKKRIIYALIGILAALPVTGAQVVREFSGQGARTTSEFEVQAPWILDWRVNSEYQKAMAIEIHLVDGVTGFQEGLILKTKYPGNGVRMFNESGRFKLRISATLSRWNLRIEELTPEEAELYTPR